MNRRPPARRPPLVDTSDAASSSRGGSAASPLEGYRDESAARLIVEVGVHQGDEVRLGAEICVIGRSSKCQLVLRRAEGVSRRHAEVEFTGSHYVVSDCGSRNGTLVNGLLVGPRFPLNDDDVLEVCDERIRFRGPSGRPEEAESAWLAAPRATTEPPPIAAPHRRGESPPPLPALKRAPASPGRRSAPPPLPPSPEPQEPEAAPPPLRETAPAPVVAAADPQAATAMLDAAALIFPQSEASPSPSAEDDVFRSEEPAHAPPEDLPPPPKARERPPPPLPAPREPAPAERAPRAPEATRPRRQGSALALTLFAGSVAVVAVGLWAWVSQGEDADEDATREDWVVSPASTSLKPDDTAASPAAVTQAVPEAPPAAAGATSPPREGPVEPAPTTPVDVRSDASGTVEEVLCKVGGEVTAGTPLLRVVDNAPRSQRKLAALRREQRAFREAAEAGDVRAKREFASIQREIADLEGARRVHVVTAPQAGRVVSIQVAVGDAVATGTAVLTLLPEDETR